MSHSNKGKSVTHKGQIFSLSIKLNILANSTLSEPNCSSVFLYSPDIIKIISPGFEEIFSEIIFKSDSEKNLSNDDLNEESLLCFIHNKPEAPI